MAPRPPPQHERPVDERAGLLNRQRQAGGRAEGGVLGIAERQEAHIRPLAQTFQTVKLTKKKEPDIWRMRKLWYPVLSEAGCGWSIEPLNGKGP